MRLLATFFVFVGLCVGGVPVKELLETVRVAMRAGRGDVEVARAVSAVVLTEKLDPAVVEELQSEGAGPDTLEALERLKWLSARFVPAGELDLFAAPDVPPVELRAEIIAAARAEALRYTASLPNFICTQVVSRFEDARMREDWKQVDSLKIATAFNGTKETYKLLEINGKPTKKDLRSVGGFRSSGEFGGTLRMIFQEKSETEFQWERWSRLRGRLAYVFRYRVPQAHSNYSVGFRNPFSGGSEIAGMVGSVWIDQETKRVLRLTDEAEELPPDWPIRATPSVMDYDWADVGGVKYLLPRRVDSRVVRTKNQRRNVTEFSEYKKFSTEATVSFEAAP